MLRTLSPLLRAGLAAMAVLGAAACAADRLAAPSSPSADPVTPAGGLRTNEGYNP